MDLDLTRELQELVKTSTQLLSNSLVVKMEFQKIKSLMMHSLKTKEKKEIGEILRSFIQLKVEKPRLPRMPIRKLPKVPSKLLGNLLLLDMPSLKQPIRLMEKTLELVINSVERKLLLNSKTLLIASKVQVMKSQRAKQLLLLLLLPPMKKIKMAKQNQKQLK